MAKKRTKSKKIEPVIAQEKMGRKGRLYENLTKTTQQFMSGKSYSPLNFNELMSRLGFAEQHAEMLEEVLEQLVKDKTIILKDSRYSIQKPEVEVVTGTLSLHPRGFGFVKTNAGIADIFIPKHLTMNAVDGDTVEVVVSSIVSEKGPEGKIVTITSRARTHLAGIIREVARDGSYYAYAPMLGLSQKILVETDHEDLIIGDRIVMHVVEWGDKDSLTIARLSSRLGHISDPSCDITAAIEEFELRRDFPTKALEEAEAFGTQVPLSEIRKREDLRGLTCLTIDPDTAKDFDDAISLTKDEKGHYHLGVHIADVSFYVRPGTALDVEASKRCNSTYFPGFCLPMLPHELSSNLCSLKANVNRLTASVIMEFDPDGNMVNYRMARTVIKSAKRFTYKEAKAVLDGKKKSPHKEALVLMVEMCGLLKKKRYERGSVEFGMPELVVLVNDKGVPTGTDYIVYDITHQLVEEFMLKANEVVAYHLSSNGKHLTYRVHDVPSEENLKDFSLLAGAFGFDLSPTPTPKEIQKLFDEAMQTPYGEYLATSYIRRMRLAIYSSDNIGHYGLSLSHYCHFTSPIRRYVDLVVHRILFQEEEEKETLERISEECSSQERISAKAENSVVLLKKLRMLEAFHKENPYKEYEAVVTRVKNFGIYFEVLELMLESYLHVSELDNDYFNYDEEKMVLQGVHHGFAYKAGDKMTVMLKAVDLITLESKWNLAGSAPQEDKRTQRRDSSRKENSARENNTRERSSKNRNAKDSGPKEKNSRSVSPKETSRDVFEKVMAGKKRSKLKGHTPSKHRKRK